jgi:hypothetical protein
VLRGWEVGGFFSQIPVMKKSARGSFSWSAPPWQGVALRTAVLRSVPPGDNFRFCFLAKGASFQRFGIWFQMARVIERCNSIERFKGNIPRSKFANVDIPTVSRETREAIA